MAMAEVLACEFLQRCSIFPSFYRLPTVLTRLEYRRYDLWLCWG